MGDVLELLESRGGESSALSEIEQRGELFGNLEEANMKTERRREQERLIEEQKVAEAAAKAQAVQDQMERNMQAMFCLLYTSPSPRDRTRSRMPSSA